MVQQLNILGIFAPSGAQSCNLRVFVSVRFKFVKGSFSQASLSSLSTLSQLCGRQSNKWFFL